MGSNGYIETSIKPEWDKTGLLSGLDDNQSKLLISIYDQINWDKVQGSGLEMFLPASIRRIFSYIIDGESQLPDIEKHIIYVDDLIQLINVAILENQLYTFVHDVFPLIKLNLRYLDYEVEMLRLFSINYTLGLIDEYLNNKK